MNWLKRCMVNKFSEDIIGSLLLAGMGTLIGAMYGALTALLLMKYYK